MKGSVTARIERLEQKAPPEEPAVIVVDWSENPEPPGPGVRVVNWPEPEVQSESSDAA